MVVVAHWNKKACKNSYRGVHDIASNPFFRFALDYEKYSSDLYFRLLVCLLIPLFSCRALIFPGEGDVI